MIFVETALPETYLVESERLEDERGFFARTWCAREFERNGLSPAVVQCSVSYSAARGTLRGLHYQAPPFEEAKLVRCTAGAIYDVAVDLRPSSPTYLQSTAHVLSADNRALLYVPEGCAHGFLTLADDVEVFYQMSQFYSPEHARGVRWDDPALRIDWPEEVRVISERDRELPDLEP